MPEGLAGHSAHPERGAEAGILVCGVRAGRHTDDPAHTGGTRQRSERDDRVREAPGFAVEGAARRPTNGACDWGAEVGRCEGVLCRSLIAMLWRVES